MKELKRLVRCENGHFFDGGKYPDGCPHCNNNHTIAETSFYGKKEEDPAEIQQVNNVVEDVEPAAVVNEPEVQPEAEKEHTFIMEEPEENKEKTILASYAAPVNIPPVQEDDGFTRHFFQQSLGTEPVVGWVVCVKGVHFGEDFKIKSGRNFIGRSAGMNICLSGDKSVSRDKHAILTYDPKSNTFLIQPGDSSELCYLNDEPVLIPVKLKANDKITLGETELVFVPFCSESFKWNK